MKPHLWRLVCWSSQAGPQSFFETERGKPRRSFPFGSHT